MAVFDCTVTEEEIFDYIRGRLPAWKRSGVETHLARCARCASVHREWRELLAAETQGRLQAVEPSAGWKRSWRRKIVRLGWRNRLAGIRIRLPRPFAFAAAALLCFLVAIAGMKQAEETVLPSRSSAVAEEEEVLRKLSMVIDSRTVQYRVTPVVAARLNGYAWVNAHSEEVVLLVEGLRFESDKDLQVWSVADGIRRKLGLMRWTNGKAHLYYRGGELHGAEHLILSVEPKGGSMLPAGPDMGVVKLRAKD